MPARTRRAIDRHREVLVSAISWREVAMLVAKGRLGLNQDVLDWIETALALPEVVLQPLTPRIVVLSTSLPGTFHGDPADRIVVATAVELDVALVTRDASIQNYGHVRTVW
ncbi:type II toxin-antitoxin system VapC family toxin [Myxococcota bacterium]|nr:type II toxin-antitoxin system VapC family toxin [Myxococcota bacterium]